MFRKTLSLLTMFFAVLMLASLQSASHAQKAGKISLTSSVVFNGVSHTVSINGTTTNSVDSGYISLGIGNSNRIYYRGTIKNLVYNSRYSADIYGIVTVNNVPTPVEIHVRFSNRAWRVGYTLFSENEYIVPMLKLYGSCSLFSY